MLHFPVYRRAVSYHIFGTWNNVLLRGLCRMGKFGSVPKIEAFWRKRMFSLACVDRRKSLTFSVVCDFVNTEHHLCRMDQSSQTVSDAQIFRATIGTEHLVWRWNQNGIENLVCCSRCQLLSQQQHHFRKWHRFRCFCIERGRESAHCGCREAFRLFKDRDCQMEICRHTLLLVWS